MYVVVLVMFLEVKGGCFFGNGVGRILLWECGYLILIGCLGIGWGGGVVYILTFFIGTNSRLALV